MFPLYLTLSFPIRPNTKLSPICSKKPSINSIGKPSIWFIISTINDKCLFHPLPPSSITFIALTASPKSICFFPLSNNLSFPVSAAFTSSVETEFCIFSQKFLDFRCLCDKLDLEIIDEEIWFFCFYEKWGFWWCRDSGIVDRSSSYWGFDFESIFKSISEALFTLGHANSSVLGGYMIDLLCK